MNYKLGQTSPDLPNAIPYIICIHSDGKESYIPVDPANADYQKYLVWAETNTIQPAD